MYSVYTDKKIKENTFFKIKILQTINERGDLQINKVKTDSECDWSHVSIPCSFSLFFFHLLRFLRKKGRRNVAFVHLKATSYYTPTQDPSYCTSCKTSQNKSIVYADYRVAHYRRVLP